MCQRAANTAARPAQSGLKIGIAHDCKNGSRQQQTASMLTSWAVGVAAQRPGELCRQASRDDAPADREARAL